MFDTIGLIAKDGDQRVKDTVALLVHYLLAADKRILLDENSAGAYRGDDVEVTAREVLGATCDLVIVVAGDGTFLNAARDLAASGVRLLGVNLGRLGFLADIMPAEMRSQQSSTRVKSPSSLVLSRGGDVPSDEGPAAGAVSGFGPASAVPTLDTDADSSPAAAAVLCPEPRASLEEPTRPTSHGDPATTSLSS